MKLSHILWIAAIGLAGVEIYSGSSPDSTTADSITSSIEGLNPTGIPVYVILAGAALIVTWAGKDKHILKKV